MNVPALDIEDVLLRALRRHDDGSYDPKLLHYGKDLSTDACSRATWYRLRGVTKDPLTLGDEIRFHGGRLWENLLVEALRDSGETVLTQSVIRPLRPSAWAWIGRADAVLPGRKLLLEVKAPRARSFTLSRGDAGRLVREDYRWQLSAYYHDLARRGIVDKAAWIFIDREGSNAPVIVPLEAEHLVPVEKIISREEELGRILLQSQLPGADTEQHAPDRIAGTTEVRVWKGSKKAPYPVKSFAVRHWRCDYCPYVNTCQPAAAEAEVTVPDGWVELSKRRAQTAWAEGEKTTPQVVRFADGAVISQSIESASAAADRDTESKPDLTANAAAEAPITRVIDDPIASAMDELRSGGEW